MMKKNVLFINGVPDNQEMTIRKIAKDGTIQWWGSGTSNISPFIEKDLFNHVNLVFDTRADQVLPQQNIHAVFNQISDADTHKNVLKKADAFYKIVSKHVPFFNPPALIMNTTRDNIYKLLQGIEKLHVPKTVKIRPRSSSDIYKKIKQEKFEYPVIFRKAGDHGGISTIRVDDETEAFHAFPLDGREYYLTQFVEYKEDGLYWKHRLVIIDGEVYLRHVKISEEWIVHHNNQISNPEKLQEAAAKWFDEEIKSAIEPIIKEIYKRLKLDYFGIDCYIDKDMNILVFEININMAILLQAEGDFFTDYHEKIRQALIKMIVSER